MALFTFSEIIALVILTITIGYIFTGYIKKPKTALDLVYSKKGFSWEDFKFALIITAPAVVLHELAHKFVAMAFGLSAVFKVFWQGLGLAIFLKLISSPFLIIAPGYVLISQGATHFQNLLISFSGPAINLILFAASYFALNRLKLNRIQAVGLYLTKQINLFLFIFNMLPIPPLDGSKVIYSLYFIFKNSFFSF